MDGRSLSSRVSTVEWLGWQEEEGGTVLVWMPVISLGWCYEPRLKVGIHGEPCEGVQVGGRGG
jgi:hypothetical protein